MFSFIKFWRWHGCRHIIQQILSFLMCSRFKYIYMKYIFQEERNSFFKALCQQGMVIKNFLRLMFLNIWFWGLFLWTASLRNGMKNTKLFNNFRVGKHSTTSTSLNGGQKYTLCTFLQSLKGLWIVIGTCSLLWCCVCICRVTIW